MASQVFMSKPAKGRQYSCLQAHSQQSKPHGQSHPHTKHITFHQQMQQQSPGSTEAENEGTINRAGGPSHPTITAATIGKRRARGKGSWRGRGRKGKWKERKGREVEGSKGKGRERREREGKSKEAKGRKVWRKMIDMVNPAFILGTLRAECRAIL